MVSRHTSQNECRVVVKGVYTKCMNMCMSCYIYISCEGQCYKMYMNLISDVGGDWILCTTVGRKGSSKMFCELHQFMNIKLCSYMYCTYEFCRESLMLHIII